MPHPNERLGQLLVQAGLITEPQLEDALARQKTEGGRIGDVLVRNLVVTEDAIAHALAEQKGYPYVSLAGLTIDRSAAMALPLGMARRRVVIPVSVNDGLLTLAMANPLDVEAIDEAEYRTGLRVEPVVAAESQVRLAIEKYIAGNTALQALEVLESDDQSSSIEAAEDASVPIVRMVNQLIREAVLERASDIHFEPTEAGVRVRYRVDGVLRRATLLPRAAQAELLSRVKVMADLDITERRRPQDGRIAINVDGTDLDLRVATLPTPLGESITLRILDSEMAFHPVDELGLGESDFARLTNMASRPYGALFVSGPTGSGKSTTLYALLNELNDESRKTITVEDPIEYRMDGVTQIAVNSRIGITFANGLRTILRADPDIVMVGEVRDPETAEIAIRAALTGHLVLSSIHTNDAPSALTRLTDMGVPPYITSSALIGVVAQRLVRVLCPCCKQKVSLPVDRLLAAGFTQSEVHDLEPYGPVGCEQCSKTGYRGRIGVFEIMPFDQEIAALYLRQAPWEELREKAIAQGMRTLLCNARQKVVEGVTSLDEVERVVM